MKNILKIIVFIYSILILSFNVYLDYSFYNDKVIDFEIKTGPVKEETIVSDEKEEQQEEKEWIVTKNSKIYLNKNYIGNLKISGTNFVEPIYKYKDNDYYLTHDGRGYKKSSGATYMDYRVSKRSKKILIYGHNNDSLSLPFSILENYNDKDYLDGHKYLILDIDGDSVKYEIFSIYIATSNWDYMRVNFDSKMNWYSHLRDLKSRSLYDTGVDISSDDDILILQTCSKNKAYSKYSRKYMLVIAKKVKQ